MRNSNNGSNENLVVKLSVVFDSILYDTQAGLDSCDEVHANAPCEH